MNHERLARLDARRNEAMRRPPERELLVARSGASIATKLHALVATPIHAVSGFRCEGAADDAGCGWLTHEHPFGGSVIEGYSTTYWVLPSDAVIHIVPDDEAPPRQTKLSIWLSDPAGNTTIDEFEARLRHALRDPD